MTATSTNGRCWIQRDFLKDKLRVKERYWHFLGGSSLPEQLTVTHRHHSRRWIIPDAPAWRKYLSLIIYLIERQREQATVSEEASSSTEASSSSLKWILLESVVEWMDYRNMSATVADDNTIVSPPEAAAPQERFKLQKLLQRPFFNNHVAPFCDLSVRLTEDDDEWTMMNYPELSIPQRSQNALFRAARLLQQCSRTADNTDATSVPEIWILSGDVDFVRRFPEEDGVRTILMQDLLQTNKHWFLLEENDIMEHAIRLATKCEEEYAARNSNVHVSLTPSVHNNVGVQEYWTDEAVQRGLLNKKLCKGRFNVTKENPKEAVVQGADGNSYFVTQQHGYFNRALHQDIVVVQLLPKEQWSSPVGKRRLVPIRNDDNDIVEEENDAMHQEEDDKTRNPPVPSGRVVAIVQVSRRQFVATMVNTPMSDESACIVVPMDVRIPKIRIKTNAWHRFIGKRLWVQIDGWEIDSNHPSGHCIDILGPIADLETEITCLLKENQIYLEPFSAAAQACLPLKGHDWKIPDSEISIRRDLRSLSIFSVDPVGCQDIDDTMHARVLPNGDIEVGVHIADVTYFVEYNSALDREARARATTFYLVDRRFDMLPALLSSDLCSLHGDVDRLAVSTVWTFSSDFKTVKNFWYGRSVIHNVQAMTYEQAHNILHDFPPDDPSDPVPPPLTAGYPVNRTNVQSLKKELGLLTKLTRILRKDREDMGGAVDLSSGDQGNELKFLLDAQGNPVRVSPKKQMEIHHTIAELMILANTYVAKTIYERFPESALLRIHQNVDESRFEDLKEVLKAGNIEFDGSSNKKLAGSLKKAESKTDSTVSLLFQSLATRAMSEARYVSTGEIRGESGLSHYGLGLEKYTHFTSPIRRYADVVVHRQLLLSLTPKKPALSRPPPGFGREALASLPESEMISILRGEGLDSSPIKQDHTGDVVVLTERFQKETIAVTGSQEADLYNNKQVSEICDNLNQQNRVAKLSSFECQNLFLSLYFKGRSDVTRAVVTNLRANGFFAYVPRFDFRAPVYLSDKDGYLQIDPRLLNLSPSEGTSPSAGFAASPRNRKFSSGKCTLRGSTGDESLELSVPGTSTKYWLKVLDVVTISISCDDWNTKSRIPQPRIHLIAGLPEATSPCSRNKNLGKASDESRAESVTSQSMTTTGPVNDIVPRSLSLYDEIARIETPTNLEAGFRVQPKKLREESTGTRLISGRVVFGGFVNPDTRSARQEAAIQEASEAAIERRNQVLTSRARQGEFEETKRIEKEVTARMQRLAVSKRNTRMKGREK